MAIVHIPKKYSQFLCMLEFIVFPDVLKIHFPFFFLLKFWFGFFIDAFQFNQKKYFFFSVSTFLFLHVILQFDHIVIVCTFDWFSVRRGCVDNRVCHNSTIEFWSAHWMQFVFFCKFSCVYVCKCSLRPLARMHAPCRRCWYKWYLIVLPNTQISSNYWCHDDYENGDTNQNTNLFLYMFCLQ